MTTFADMRAAIADDIDDTTGEYAAQIGAAIQAAIRYCERKPFYFNETRDITFNTAASQQTYDGTSAVEIETAPQIQAIYLTVGGQVRGPLQRITPEEMETLSDNSASVGEPDSFCWFDKKLRLYPVPGDAYQVRLQIGPYRLAMPTQDADESAWFDEAYDVIKARAKYIVYKDTLKDAPKAAEALNDFMDQLGALEAETARRVGAGFIRPTCF